MTLLAVLCSFPANADKVYYVDPDGNAPEGMTVDAVYTKVAAAINHVTAGEPVTIYLKPGHTFTETNMTTGTNRVDLTLIGDSTTINAGAAQRILRTEAARLELKGIIFTGVKDYTSMGGVLYFAGNGSESSELLIDSCVFDGNVLASGANAYGGAALATGTNAMNVTVRNSIFRNNQAAGYSDSAGDSAHRMPCTRRKGTHRCQGARRRGDCRLTRCGNDEKVTGKHLSAHFGCEDR